MYRGMHVCCTFRQPRVWQALLRLVYLAIANAFALLRLLPGSDRDKDVEILALRHELVVLQRQLNGQRVRFQPADRAWLAALLRHLPCGVPKVCNHGRRGQMRRSATC